MDDLTSMSLVGSLMALTHAILTNLFIKLELNNFLLPPLLSIKSSWGRFLTRGEERCTFLPEKWRAWVRVCRTHQRLKSAIVLFFGYRLLLTRRWRLVEVFMTVMMYRSQKHGRRGQRIDARKPESGNVLIAGFHMTSLNFRLHNYWSSWDFTFMMY